MLDKSQASEALSTESTPGGKSGLFGPVDVVAICCFLSRDQ